MNCKSMLSKTGQTQNLTYYDSIYMKSSQKENL